MGARRHHTGRGGRGAARRGTPSDAARCLNGRAWAPARRRAHRRPPFNAPLPKTGLPKRKPSPPRRCPGFPPPAAAPPAPNPPAQSPKSPPNQLVSQSKTHRGAVQAALPQQLLHVSLVRVLVAPDLLVHEGLREHGLVDLVVAVLPGIWLVVWPLIVSTRGLVFGGRLGRSKALCVRRGCCVNAGLASPPIEKAPPPVADQVHHDVGLPPLTPLHGQLAGAHLWGGWGWGGG